MENITTNITIVNGESSTSVIPFWSNVFVIVFMSIIILLGVFGNGLIILILTGMKTKFSTDYYILTMAIVDFICSGLNAPLYIVRNVESAWTIHGSTRFCQVHASMLYLTNMASTLLLTAIAVDRYIVTCRPHARVGTNWSTRTVYVNIAISGISLAYAIGIASTQHYDQQAKDCFFDGSSGYIMSGILTVMFVSLFVSAVFCYTKISLTLRMQQNLALRGRFQRQRQKLSKTMTNSRNNYLKKFARFNFTTNKINPLNDLKNKNVVHTSQDLFTQPIAERQSGDKAKGLNSNSENPAILQDNSFNCSSADNAYSIEIPENGMAINSFLHRNRATRGRADGVMDTEIVKYKKQRNTTITLIVFLLTAVYISTWVINWASNALNTDSITLNGIKHITRKLFMLNSITNPVFYMALSTKFRLRVITTCQKGRCCFSSC